MSVGSQPPSFEDILHNLQNGNPNLPPRTIHDLPTPSFIVDIDKLKTNAESMLRRARELKVDLRPHIKTHKAIQPALYQLYGSAVKTLTKEHFLRTAKITVSTLGEARFFGQYFPDILYAVPIVKAKMLAVYELASRIRRLSVLVDTSQAARDLIAFVDLQKEANVKVGVYVDVDTGYHRSGFDPLSAEGQEAIRALQACPRLEFVGLYTHGGNSYTANTAAQAAEFADQEAQGIAKFADQLRSAGLAIPTVAVGSTPTCSNPSASSWAKIDEIHPGNYIFYDVFQSTIGSCQLKDNAGFVVSRVLSSYKNPSRLLIDAGALALSKDTGPTHVPGHTEVEWGKIEGFEDKLVISKITQELGVVYPRIAGSSICDEIPVGHLFKILPNHSCLTAACYSKYYVVDSAGKVIDEWGTAPREW